MPLRAFSSVSVATGCAGSGEKHLTQAQRVGLGEVLQRVVEQQRNSWLAAAAEFVTTIQLGQFAMQYPCDYVDRDGT